MSDKRQRIDSDVSEDIKFIKRWIRLTKNKRLDFSGTVDYILQEFIENHNIVKETDITDRKIMINDNILRTEYRVDTNMPSNLRDDIKIIQYVMNKDRREEEKKLTMDDVIRMMVDKTFELYPEIKKIKNEDKYIVQKIHFEEIRKRKQGYYNTK